MIYAIYFVEKKWVNIILRKPIRSYEGIVLGLLKVGQIRSQNINHIYVTNDKENKEKKIY